MAVAACAADLPPVDQLTGSVRFGISATTGDTLRNVARLETVGSPDIGWVRVIVDTIGGQLFSFELREMPSLLPW